MPRPLLCALACAAALVARAHAAEPVTREQALDAIRVFEANAMGPSVGGHAQDPGDTVAKASNTVLRFALESDAVVVDLGTDSVTWCDVRKGLADLPLSGERGLLLAAYLSGCVKAQLHSGRQDANPYEGWIEMLRVYRALKMRESVSIPEAEHLLARQVDGTLRQAADEALARSTEKLHRAYPGAAPKPGPGQP